MPIIDIQKRLHEVGRIRLGEQVANKSGNGTHPAKLDRFRFTSDDKHSIDLVAKVYGGEVRPWEGASVGTQWELYTESTDLDVIVPPVDLAFEQWMENWSGGICRNRCDGERDNKNDTPCSCDPDAPTCKPTTRLGVILTAVNGIGRWRLETHGWAAASELSGSIEILKTIQNRGAMVPARLLLKQRQQKKIGADGKPETLNYAVPVLDLNLSVAALTGGTMHQLETGATPIVRSDEPTLSIADQVRATEAPAEKPKRANAAAAIPATGIAPRPATAIVEDVEAKYTPPAGTVFLTEKQGPMIARLFGKIKVNDRDDRLKYLEETFGHPFDSSKQLSKAEATTLISELMAIAGEEEKPRIPSAPPAQAVAPMEEPPYEEDEMPF